ncbi:MAG: spherulation-specific family 4 protein [Anaerolineales bacterium]|nr:spherulation-specific family 4 protein [Anaerolineales bacterium]
MIVAVLSGVFFVASLAGLAQTTTPEQPLMPPGPSYPLDSFQQPNGLTNDQTKTTSAYATTTSGCKKTQLLIPLYSYPNWYDPSNYIWDDIATATDQISVTVIINPNNGPGSCPPNSDYQHGINDLHRGQVTILGYVYTSYGSRATKIITNEIDLYDQCFDIDGIFLDEVASTADKCDYYEQLCDDVKSSPNLDKVFINPGLTPDECYFSHSSCDTGVIFEGYSSHWLTYTVSPYVAVYPSERFAAIVHTVPDTDTMKSNIDLTIARHISYVYLTDDTLPNPYDSLPLFQQAQIDYIKSVNICKTWLPIILHTH